MRARQRDSRADRRVAQIDMGFRSIWSAGQEDACPNEQRDRDQNPNVRRSRTSCPLACRHPSKPEGGQASALSARGNSNLRRRSIVPTRPKPANIINQVAGSGTIGGGGSPPLLELVPPLLVLVPPLLVLVPPLLVLVPPLLVLVPPLLVLVPPLLVLVPPLLPPLLLPPPLLPPPLLPPPLLPVSTKIGVPPLLPVKTGGKGVSGASGETGVGAGATLNGVSGSTSDGMRRGEACISPGAFSGTGVWIGALANSYGSLGALVLVRAPCLRSPGERSPRSARMSRAAATP